MPSAYHCFVTKFKEYGMVDFSTMKKALFGSLVIAALAAFTTGCSASSGPGDNGKCGSSKCGSSKSGDKCGSAKCGS